METGHLLQGEGDHRFIELSSYYDVDLNGVAIVEQTIAAIDVNGGVNLIKISSGGQKMITLRDSEMQFLVQEYQQHVQQNNVPLERDKALWDVPYEDESLGYSYARS